MIKNINFVNELRLMSYIELLNYCYNNKITIKMINKGTKKGIIKTILLKQYKRK